MIESIYESIFVLSSCCIQVPLTVTPHDQSNLRKAKTPAKRGRKPATRAKAKASPMKAKKVTPKAKATPKTPRRAPTSKKGGAKTKGADDDEDATVPKSTRGRPPKSEDDGKTYGCARCRQAALGCKTCRNPNFKPRVRKEEEKDAKAKADQVTVAKRKPRTVKKSEIEPSEPLEAPKSSKSSKSSKSKKPAQDVD